MVRCWNCEHVIRIYSGKPANEKLFENEFRMCTVNGMVFERYDNITEARECEDYKESKHKMKYEEVADFGKGRFYVV